MNFVIRIGFGSGKMLPPPIKSGEAVINLKSEFSDTGYLTNIDATMKSIVFENRDFNKNSEMDILINDIYKDLKLITIKAKIKKADGDEEISLKSNLDEYFNKQIKAIMDKKMAQAKAKLRAQLSEKIQGMKSNLEKQVLGEWGSLDTLANSKENGLNEINAEIDKNKKVAEDKLNEEKKKQTDALKNTANDMLKSLF